VSRPPADTSEKASTAPAPAAGEAGSEDNAEAEEIFPAASRYAVERWAELTDAKAPWWAMPTGVGLRLQLNELQQLAKALQEGKVVAGAVSGLLERTQDTFVMPGRYASEAFPEIRQSMQKALKKKDPADLLPGGVTLAAIEAAKVRLDEEDLVDSLTTDLGTLAASADSIEALLAIDERVTLLDAELAFLGYSRVWRARAAGFAREEVEAEADLSSAIKTGKEKAGERASSSFEAFVPLKVFVPDGEVVHMGSMLEKEKAEDRLAEWADGGSLLGSLADVEVVLRLSKIEARDIDGAAEQARDSLARHLSLWDLQDVRFELSGDLLLRNASDETQIAERRSVSGGLVKRPPGLKGYEAARKEHEDDVAIRRITDALDQLAQARSGSQGASLADLWTVSETLFGGLVGDKSVEVTDQVAGIAEYLYVRDFLSWLGSRLDPNQIDLEGLEVEGESEAEWALRSVRERGEALPQKLVEADLPLEWLRFEQVRRWNTEAPGSKKESYLGVELGMVSARVVALGNRAYLVRNLFLHQGNPERAAAMAVTLPIFSAVVRAVVGHVNQLAGTGRLPLVESHLARFKAQHVAAVFAAEADSELESLADFIDLADE